MLGIRAVLVSTLAGRTLYNVANFIPIGAGTPPTLTSSQVVLNDSLTGLAKSVLEKFTNSTYLYFFSTQFNFVRVETQFFGTTEEERAALPANLGTYSAPTAGTSAGQYLPDHVVTSTRFTRPKKNVRHGYKRMSGLTETHHTDGKMSSTDRNDFNLYMGFLLTPAINVTAYPNAHEFWGYALISKNINGQPSPDWIVERPSSVFTRLDFSTQNSRKVRA